MLLLVVVAHCQTATQQTQSTKLIHEFGTSHKRSAIQFTDVDIPYVEGPFILFASMGESRAGKSQTLNFFIKELTGKEYNVFRVAHFAESVTEGADIFILE